MTLGEAPPDDVAFINEHGRRHYGGVLECRATPTKGRVVHAARSFRAGAEILREKPLHKVQAAEESPAYRRLRKLCADQEDDFDFEPLWYWCALRSLTAKQLVGAFAGGWEPVEDEVQKKLLMLHHEKEPLESTPFASARVLAAQLAPGASVALLEELTQVWVLNCFDYTDNPPGYCTYFFSSFMSHSCQPNAFWHYDGDLHVLRAREDIDVGDEVCISYLSEDWLVMSVAERRQDLFDTKHFRCNCPRCVGDADRCRGFQCIGCSEGQVFPRATLGDPPPEDERLAPPDFSGAACAVCGRPVTPEEAANMCKFEAKAGELVKLFQESPSADSARWLEENVPAVLGQHFLASHAWEALADFYEEEGAKKIGDRLRALRRLCLYHSEAYPCGRSGAHASALEALADALASSGGVAAANEAVALYAQSCEITALLYGEGSKEAVRIARKRAALLPRTFGAAAAAPKQRTRRTQGVWRGGKRINGALADAPQTPGGGY